jgi:hypothetical protein
MTSANFREIRSPDGTPGCAEDDGLIRFHAAEYHIDPHKIGVLRTSAGRHLVVDLSTHFETRWPELVETWLRTIGVISP